MKTKIILIWGDSKSTHKTDINGLFGLGSSALFR